MARYYRKVIRITARESPNVALGLLQQERGVEPTGEVIIPGVLPWYDYVQRMATWDAVRRCIGLDAMFWLGAEILMFPPEWLDRAEKIARDLRGKPRWAKGLGCDPAEGGASTAMCAVDEYGLIELVSKQTPDTSVITGEAIAFMKRHNCPPERFCFDAGGGGTEHADRLRSQGYNVRAIPFGSAVSLPIRSGKHTMVKRREIVEDRYVYLNRRAEMYGDLRMLLDPAPTADSKGNLIVSRGFGLPAEYRDIRHQLAPIPLLYDDEGRMFLLPKGRRGNEDGLNSAEKNRRPTLTQLIGRSPDEADSLVLAVHSMLHDAPRSSAGAF